MLTARRSAVGSAPIDAIVSFLNSITLGWSISYTTVPSGQSSRYARASRPDARITACRTPAAAASLKKSSKNLVRTAITFTISRVASAAVVVGLAELAVEQPDEEVQSDGAHQWFGERVVDECVGLLARYRPRRGDHRRGRTDAGRHVPGVRIGPRHSFIPRLPLAPVLASLRSSLTLAFGATAERAADVAQFGERGACVEGRVSGAVNSSLMLLPFTCQPCSAR